MNIRARSLLSKETIQSMKHHQDTQTENLQSKPLPVRLSPSRQKHKTWKIEPRYLEAILLLMAENLSASDAIRAVFIIVAVV